MYNLAITGSDQQFTFMNHSRSKTERFNVSKCTYLPFLIKLKSTSGNVHTTGNSHQQLVVFLFIFTVQSSAGSVNSNR